MKIEIEIRKARKDYKCDYSGTHIKIGTKYKRVNIAGVGVFHFAIDIPDKKVKSFVDGKSYDSYMRKLDEIYMYAYFDCDDEIQ